MGNERASSTKGALGVIGSTLVLGLWLVWTGPKTEPRGEVRRAKIVKTIPVQPAIHRISLTAYGTVIPARRVTIEPQVSGQIIRQHPALIPGGYVRKGEELFEIDPTLIQLSIRESSAAVARAEAALKEARRKQTEAGKLAKERVIANTELAALDSAVQIQLAESQRLNASLAQRRELLQRHVVRAPFNALVLEESVEIGQRVDPGFVAATLVGTDHAWVRVSLPVDRLKWIKLPSSDQPGAEADVYLDTGNGDLEHRRGRVVRLLGDMERAGRMARVLVEVEDPFALKLGGPHRVPLLLGSYLRIEIDAGELKNVLAIARSALREGNRIWVVDSENKLRIRDIHVRWRQDETVYIDNALHPGESLIVSALRVALPGMKVKRQRAEPTPPKELNLTQHRP